MLPEGASTATGGDPWGAPPVGVVVRGAWPEREGRAASPPPPPVEPDGFDWAHGDPIDHIGAAP